jgi:phospholipase/lecithinase/hemolysin
VRETVVAFNDEIAGAITEVEQSHGVRIARVDTFALFDDLATNGYDVAGDGGLVLTTHYLGGVFSLDGIHPTRTGHALIANAFIAAINARFGEAIPAANVARIARRDRLVGNRFRPAGEPPFGVVADVDVEVADSLDAALARVEDSADDIVHDLRRSFGRFRHFLDGIF